jgi:hypothetical protein
VKFAANGTWVAYLCGCKQSIISFSTEAITGYRENVAPRFPGGRATSNLMRLLGTRAALDTRSQFSVGILAASSTITTALSRALEVATDPR